MTFKPIICIDTEEWRAVVGFLYEVSSHGRVRRSEGGSGNAKAGRILKPKTDQDGYKIVRLCRDGVAHDRKVHRLVCAAFNGAAPHPDALVRHRDGNPAHNTPGNLRWGTELENANDRASHGRTAKGERSPRARLTAAQAETIRRRHAEARIGRQRVPRGLLPALASEFGMSVHGIATIVAGRGYT